MEKLTGNFLHELFRSCMINHKVMDICNSHFKFEYIPDDLSGLKLIWKSIKVTFSSSGKVPSFGVISQQNENSISVQEELGIMKSIDIKILNEDSLLEELEDYIKNVSFSLLNQKIVNLYNNDRQDEAIKLSAEESAKLANFSLKNNSLFYMRSFTDFDKFMIDQQNNFEENGGIEDKIKFDIDELDEMTYGGMDITDTLLFVARSGVGKSTFARWLGYRNCVYYGRDVLHIQLEGSKEEAFGKYAQMWTKQSLRNIRRGDISNASLDKVQKFLNNMKRWERDIDIYASEKFDEVSMVDIRNIAYEYQKIKGKFPDLIIIDSLDLCHPGDGLKYGYDTQSVKMKKNNTAKAMKNLATEIRTRIATVDQASDVNISNWNDPDYVMTRSDISGDKNLVNAFSFVLTGNQTVEEMKNNVSKPIVKICTNYSKGIFYDTKRTKETILNV